MMRTIVIFAVVVLSGGMVKGYVYSYLDSMSINNQGGGDLPEPIRAGPNPPAGISPNLVIAGLNSSSSITGRTPSSNAGEIIPYNIQQSPAPLTVVVDSPTALLGPDATPLSVGDTVGPNSTWGSSGWVYGYIFPSQTIGNPAFLAPQGAYVGIQFPDGNNQIHYGWLLVRYDQPLLGDFGTIELLQVGYETDPGVPITIAPEPELGMLGIFAIAAIRRRRWMR